jgi:hypothetical protein
MTSTAIILGLLIILLLGIVFYLIINPIYEIIPTRHSHYRRPHSVMPHFGPYWAHGGQINTDLLY